MDKFKNRVLAAAIALFWFTAAAWGQSDKVAEREAEWQSYKIPAASYVRHVLPSREPSAATDSRNQESETAKRDLRFRVPVDWKEGPSLTFNGPDGSSVRLVTDVIADGIPLSQYVTSVLQSLADRTGAPDSILVRTTEMAGDEGREIMLELPDARGVVRRRTVWITVSGPTAVVFVFATPAARAAEVEPYFKGIVQSLVVSRGEFDWAEFETLRKAAIKEDRPERIDQVMTLADSVDRLSGEARSQAASKLGALLSESQGALLDLMVDRRPAVRSAAVEAIAASGTSTYDPILLRSLKDRDAQVAERAAKALSARKDVQAMLREQTGDWHENEALFRVWPFLNGNGRKQIVNEIFSRQNFRPSSGPPPPAHSGAGEGGQAGNRKPARNEKGTRNSKGVVTIWGDSSPEYNRLFTALSLLRDIPISDQSIPLDEIAASGYDVLIAPALQIGLERHERFRTDTLLKLLSSPSPNVRRLAAWSLVDSAAAADIPRIEMAARRPSQAPARPDAKPDEQPKAEEPGDEAKLAREIRATAKKIRLRDRIAGASPSVKDQIIKESLADPEIADWVWWQYAQLQYEQDHAGWASLAGGAGSAQDGPTAGVPVDPRTADARAGRDQRRTGGKEASASKSEAVRALGENVFPSRVNLYAAMRNPAATFQKLGDSLTGIQMDTARDQALFVLILSSVKAQLARSLGGSAGQPVLGNTGIDLTAPIAVGKWTAEGAPEGLKAAQRKAVIMRVSDREKFERLLGMFQMRIGGFGSFTEGFSIASRFIGLMPAVLPSAATMINGVSDEKKYPRAYKYQFRAADEVFGHPVTVIERRQASPDGEVETDSICLTYVGDEAIIAPDLLSLGDALRSLASGKSALSENAEFRRAASQSGDVIYLSDLSPLGARTQGSAQGKARLAISENGALTISDTDWANSYSLSIPDSTWLKPLQRFKPETHPAAKELLPSSTVIYLLLQLDVASAWRGLKLATSADNGAIKDIASAFSLDFEKEILPELGPECGAALLGVPNMDGKFSAPWVIFFKLKSSRLADAMREGRLIKGSVGSGDKAHFKLGSKELAIGIKNGFLVIGSNAAALGRLEGTEKLASARDFTRAAHKAPAEVVAFGGYNLEAATAEIKEGPGDYRNDAIIRVLKSVVKAFHSQSFYVTAEGQRLEARMSVSLDREGRYSVAELASLSKDYRPAFATVEAKGAPISDQESLSALKLRIRVKAAGAIDRIVEDLRTDHQRVEKTSEQDLVVSVEPRRAEPRTKVKLPVADKEFAKWLEPTPQIRSDDKDIIARAREIAGSDTDAWSVAGKLADWVYKNLKWRVVEARNAAHTLATREAACLEFSELYVALARSLGLPARIVTGLAHTEGSFGGHAWVEVYAGQWIEMDPTWGTHFVDATHVRQTTEDLTAYVALKLAGLEVIEARRAVADFQRDPALLVGKICEELPRGKASALRAALDVAALTDRMIGPGGWASLNEGERKQILAAYNGLILDLSEDYRSENDPELGMRVLKVKADGDRADALIMSGDATPLRLKLVRRGEVWQLTDITEIDSDFNMPVEKLRPAVERIQAGRNGRHQEVNTLSPRARIAALLIEDPKAGMELLDRELEKDPRNAPLRYVKAQFLQRLQRDDEAVNLWMQLSEESPPYPPAMLELATHYTLPKQKDVKKAIEFYARYAAAVPDDPRPHESLGELYEEDGDLVRAETEFRAALERDPRNSDEYDNLARVLAIGRRYVEAAAVLDKCDKHGPGVDMFASLLMELGQSKHDDVAEGLAASQPDKMAKSAGANLNLAYIRVAADHPREALPLLKKAAELDPKSGDSYDEMAVAYRKLGDWRAALAAADSAIKISSEDYDAHYNRACALARLGRLNEALAALKRSLELDEEDMLDFETEADLKPLARLPGYKKLLADRAKEQEEAKKQIEKDKEK